MNANIDLTDEVRLAIVRRADAFRMVEITERAFHRAAQAHADADYGDRGDDGLRREVIDTFFEFCDAGRDARARDADLDRALRNLAMVPLPEEVLP